MSKTRYALQLQTAAGAEFTPVDFERATKATVVSEAQKRSISLKLAARVVTQTGAVVFELKRPAQRIITKHTKPYTRVEELDETLQALVPDGYVAAYRRPRNATIVLRNESAEAEEKYLVISEAEGRQLGFAATTRAAGVLMAAEGKKRIIAAAKAKQAVTA